MMAEPRIDRPLRGRRILITRSRDQSGDFAEILRREGAEVLQIPTIRFEPPDSWKAADAAIGRIDRYELVIFTSANGVTEFLRRITEIGGDRKRLQGKEVAAIGPKTAAVLRKEGFDVRILPEYFVAEGLVEALKARALKGAEVLIPRAQEARDLLILELERLGAKVTVAPVYRTVRAEESREAILKALEARGVDLVTFTAASTVTHFVELLGQERIRTLLRGVSIACIGPVTAEAARSQGLQPDLMPDRHTIPELAAAIVRHYSDPPSAPAGR